MAFKKRIEGKMEIELLQMERDTKVRGNREGWEGKGTKQCCVHVPASHGKCSNYALKTCT